MTKVNLRGGWAIVGCFLSLSICRGEQLASNAIPCPYSRICQQVFLSGKSSADPEKLVVLLPGTGGISVGSETYKKLSAELGVKGCQVLLVPSLHAGSAEDALNLTVQDISEEVVKVISTTEKSLGEENTRVFLVGLSEGALIAAVLAANHPELVRCLVLISSPGLPGADYSIQQVKRKIFVDGADLQDSINIVKYFSQAYAAVQYSHGSQDLDQQLSKIERTSNVDWAPEIFERQQVLLESEWMVSFIKTKPADIFKSIDCPMFLAYGEMDEELNPAKNLQAVLESLQAPIKSESKSIIFSGYTHTLASAPGHTLDKLDPLETITSWILKH